MTPPARINPSLAQDLQRQPEFRQALLESAREVKAHANQIVAGIGGAWMPRRGGTRNTVEVDASGDAVRVVNTDHGGHLQEWGSVNNAPHAPLRRGVRAAGLRLDEN